MHTVITLGRMYRAHIVAHLWVLIPTTIPAIHTNKYLNIYYNITRTTRTLYAKIANALVEPKR